MRNTHRKSPRVTFSCSAMTIKYNASRSQRPAPVVLRMARGEVWGIKAQEGHLQAARGGGVRVPLTSGLPTRAPGRLVGWTVTRSSAGGGGSAHPGGRVPCGVDPGVLPRQAPKHRLQGTGTSRVRMTALSFQHYFSTM